MKRDLLYRDLHSQVSARHHYCICRLKDSVEILHRFTFFNLGHDRNSAFFPGFAADQGAQCLDIVLSTHERESDKVDPVFDGEGGIYPVLRCE
jgi:hypothetical protein